MSDSYKTIATATEGMYKEKGSKFIAFAFPVYSEEEFKEKLATSKKDYHDARHHCYAFRLGVKMDIYRFSDDGEPSSTAGKPIYGQIQSFGLTNIGIIVIRYFGGTKLGVGGLITAYKEAAKNALENATIITRTVDDIFEIQFTYAVMSDVMNFVKQQQLEIIKQVLEESGTIEFRVRQSESNGIVTQLEKIDGVQVKLLRTV